MKMIKLYFAGQISNKVFHNYGENHAGNVYLNSRHLKLAIETISPQSTQSTQTRSKCILNLIKTIAVGRLKRIVIVLEYTKALISTISISKKNISETFKEFTMKQINLTSIIKLIQTFLEKEFGVSNLSYVDVSSAGIEFGVRAMRFVVQFQGITCHRLDVNSQMLYNDHASVLIQNRLQEYIAKELGVAK